MRAVAVLCGAWLVAGGAGLAGAQPPAASGLARFEQPIPTAATKVGMVPIPASTDGRIRAFWMSETEIPWEVFDVFAYRLDEEQGSPKADGISRPSKPYLPPDRGFGHEGYAAICMTRLNAEGFCRWLSWKSGKVYRLATAEEWEHACRAGAKTKFPFGDDGTVLGEHAWFAENSEATPHPVRSKKPNAWGLYDMLGNVQEWVSSADAKPVTMGGSFRDDAAKLTPGGRAAQEPSWNASDPQIPKSKWWLSDGSFVGFRVVCEQDPPAPVSTPGTPEKKPDVPKSDEKSVGTKEPKSNGT